MEWILATGIHFAFCCVVRVLFPVARLFARALPGPKQFRSGAEAEPVHCTELTIKVASELRHDQSSPTPI